MVAKTGAQPGGKEAMKGRAAGKARATAGAKARVQCGSFSDSAASAPSAPKQPTDEVVTAHLTAGTYVSLVGLEAYADLNGQQGHLVAFNAERDRWQVLLKSGALKNVRAVNIQKIFPAREDGNLSPAPVKRDKASPKRLKPQATPLRAKTKKEPSQSVKVSGKVDNSRGTKRLSPTEERSLEQEPLTTPSGSRRENPGSHPDSTEPDQKASVVVARSQTSVPPVLPTGPKRRKVANVPPPREAKGKQREDDEDDDVLFDVEELEGEEEVSEVSEEEIADEDDEEFEWQPVGALLMPKVWPTAGTLKPGEEGFTKQAAGCLAKAGLGTPKSPFAGLKMRLHQESASFLLHPDSPIERLLVDHATGTGKTLIMLRMLDNYFDDPRPKVAIFPKEAVCDNFYQELLKWPTRWRHFFCFLKPTEASLASGAKDWRRKKFDVWDINNERSRAEAKTRGVRLEKIIRELTESIREALEMKHAIFAGKVKAKFARVFLEEHPDAPMPRAPLRAFRYTTAGGGAATLDRDGWPKSPILKIGFDAAELNPYSGKVIIMDECHNLVRPNQIYEDQIGHLRNLLHSATRSVLAGFTGTPVGNDASEGQKLLAIIKGQQAERLSDEGFLSCFHARGSEDFCTEVPVQGIPDGVLHDGMLKDLTTKHSLHGEALKRYLLKEVEFMITPRLLQLPQEKRLARLSNYCNLHIHYGACHGAKRAALLANVKDHAPKFYGVARAVAKRQEKAVVMLSRQTGYGTLLEILRKTGRKQGFKVATMAELSDFNDGRRNLRGERFRVLVADTAQAGEGVQFKHVRRLYMVEVPVRHSDLVQRASRCVRMGGHEGLPKEERELAVEVHLVQLPSFLRKGPSSFIYRELLNAREVMSIPGASLEAATSACVKELKKRDVKNLTDFRRILQGEDGKKLIELLTETVLEILGNTNSAPARPLAVSMWQLRKRDDDLVSLERNLLKQATVKTADDLLLDRLLDKSVELLPPLEAMRLKAVDRELLAPLGDPPKAPPPRQSSAALEIVEIEDEDDFDAEEQDEDVGVLPEENELLAAEPECAE